MSYDKCATESSKSEQPDKMAGDVTSDLSCTSAYPVDWQVRLRTDLRHNRATLILQLKHRQKRIYSVFAYSLSYNCYDRSGMRR